MRYKVPQNIDMQDRIVGPLTLLQFMYLLIGGAICYLFFQILSLPLFLVCGLPIASLALALAFFKIQDQPFSKFLSSAFQYFLRPKRLVWKRQNQSSLQIPNQPSNQTNSNVKVPISNEVQNPNS